MGWTRWSGRGKAGWRRGEEKERDQPVCMGRSSGIVCTLTYQASGRRRTEKMPSPNERKGLRRWARG